ncbi:MAG: mandelate racemase/muconate lactonizing enzyme family protein [Lentisphaeria bacterium]|nr:mandelate racemase/muconate lactonizing enzyme family protein [Lentisphaeria bacterium]
MKIIAIEPVIVGAPTPGNGKLSDKNYIFVKVHTDEGITGLGEASLGGYTRTIVSLLSDLEELLIGEDPTRIEYLIQVMTRQKFWRGGVVKGSAVAGIELALWDILGKSLNVPVCRLFGGPCRNKIRVYVNGWSGGATDPALLRDRLDEAMAMGYGAFKFSIALPSWPVYDPAVTGTIARSAEVIREKIGPERLLMFDGHGRYDADSAIAVGRALEPYNLCFYEEPVSQLDEKAMARVAEAVRIPIAAGERLESRWEFRKLFEAGAVRIAQPDLAHCNGFLEGYKIAALADAFSGFLAPHCPMSPVLTVISAHLDAVAPNFLIQERLFLNDWRNSVITEPLQVREGFLELPEKPGWGIELDEAVCSAHPKIRTGIPRLFREDGAVSDW